MELRCNNLKCRQRLQDKAYVTCCSHVFCANCSAHFFAQALVCPACETPLCNKTDIFISDLKPSEEWKSMVIAAQKPDVISEVCSRALSFWSYQANQEQRYQEMLLKTAHDKRLTHEKHFNNAISRLKNELELVHARLNAATEQLEVEKGRNVEWAEQCVEKTKQAKKLQLVCDDLKRKCFSSTRHAEVLAGDEENYANVEHLQSHRNSLIGKQIADASWEPAENGQLNPQNSLNRHASRYFAQTDATQHTLPAVSSLPIGTPQRQAPVSTPNEMTRIAKSTRLRK